MEAVGQGGVDVVVALPFGGNQEGQGAVGRQDIHAAVLLAVPGQQGDAALFHIQVGRHRVERLQSGHVQAGSEGAGQRYRLSKSERREPVEESGGGGPAKETEGGRTDDAKILIALIKGFFYSPNIKLTNLGE